ncbi:hypothetical protein [Metamycoplasma buccale]|uniref:hypothetical protein n=1 Tax=Metamycoplasma buccale TaxID=55602 RepID=UPI00398F2EF2
MKNKKKSKIFIDTQKSKDDIEKEFREENSLLEDEFKYKTMGERSEKRKKIKNILFLSLSGIAIVTVLSVVLTLKSPVNNIVKYKKPNYVLEQNISKYATWDKNYKSDLTAEEVAKKMAIDSSLNNEILKAMNFKIIGNWKVQIKNMIVNGFENGYNSLFFDIYLENPNNKNDYLVLRKIKLLTKEDPSLKKLLPEEKSDFFSNKLSLIYKSKTVNNDEKIKEIQNKIKEINNEENLDKRSEMFNKFFTLNVDTYYDFYPLYLTSKLTYNEKTNEISFTYRVIYLIQNYVKVKGRKYIYGIYASNEKEYTLNKKIGLSTIENK